MKNIKIIGLFKILLFLSFLKPLSANGQIVTYKNENKLKEISYDVFYYIDPSNKLTFDQIEKKPITEFTLNAKPSLNFGNTDATFWLKVNFKNLTNEALFLNLHNLQAWFVDVYCISDSLKIDHLQSGLFRPMANRHFKTNWINFNLGKHPSVVYMAIKTPVMFLPLQVSTIQPLMEFSHKEDMFNGWILGILLALSVYNFIFFLYIKDRIFIYYCIYILASFYLIARSKGYIYEYLPNNFQFLQNDFWRSNFEII